MSRDIQEGFVSEYEYEAERPGGEERIYFPVTGHFVMIKGEPDSIHLYDDYSRTFIPLASVSMMLPVSSPKEGKKKFPRPFVFERGQDDPNSKIGSKLISKGEKLKITYIGGVRFHPLVEGALESFARIDQKAFLRYDLENLDRQVERYENDAYVLEYENDGRGGMHLSVKGKEGGTGNVEIDLEGTPNNGKITLNLTGTFAVNQVVRDGEELKVKQSVTVDGNPDAPVIAIEQFDADGNAIQSMKIDGTPGGEKITLKDKQESEITMKSTGVEITVNGDVKVTATGDASVEATGDATVKGTTVKLNSGLGNVLTGETATPACLFSGKPFLGVPTVKAG